MVFKNLSTLVLWMKVASALEGLSPGSELVKKTFFDGVGNRY